MSPSARPSADRLALVCRVAELTVLEPMAAALRASGAVVESLVVAEGLSPRTVSLELSDGDPEEIVRRLSSIAGIESVQRVPTMRQVYGQRIIVVGGGAQVGQVALDAISEADRHNIRGQKISVDTIPVVGEDPIAEAVRAVARLPRVAAVVLAGSLMGGKITEAVREVRGAGILVISLNMAGSAPREADLVVTDPVQAGVMAVMAIAETARFDIAKQRGRTY